MVASMLPVARRSRTITSLGTLPNMSCTTWIIASGGLAGTARRGMPRPAEARISRDAAAASSPIAGW